MHRSRDNKKGTARAAPLRAKLRRSAWADRQAVIIITVAQQECSDACNCNQSRKERANTKPEASRGRKNSNRSDRSSFNSNRDSRIHYGENTAWGRLARSSSADAGSTHRARANCVSRLHGSVRT